MALSSELPTGFALGKTFLDRLHVEGQFIFLTVAGSSAYNLSMNSSDKDYYGVFVAPTDLFLGLDSGDVLDTITHSVEIEGHVESLADHNLHEVGKYCQLLLKSNYAAVEALYMTRETTETPAWVKLRELRREFVNANLIKNYVGYCVGAVKFIRDHRDNKPFKRLYYCIRALNEADRVAEGLEPLVFIPEGAELEYLLSVKKGEVDFDETLTSVEARVEAFSSAKPWYNPLPSHKFALDVSPEGRAALNAWLLDVRHGRLV